MPLSLNRNTAAVPFSTAIRSAPRTDPSLRSMRLLIASRSELPLHPAVEWFRSEALTAQTCETLDGLVQCLAAPRPIDLAIVDSAMVESDRLAGLRAARQRRPMLPFIVLCRENCFDRQTAIALLREGALGLLPWTIPHHLIDAALRMVLAGQAFSPPELLIDLAASDNDSIDAKRCAPASTGRREALSRLSFSPRECDVAAYLAEGHSNKEIAHRLSIQEVTVKVYASSIYRKLGVRNRTQAAAKLLAEGMA